MTGNINETARPLVLMVTQVGCDVLIDLGLADFPAPHAFSSKLKAIFIL